MASDGQDNARQGTSSLPSLSESEYTYSLWLVDSIVHPVLRERSRNLVSWYIHQAKKKKKRYIQLTLPTMIISPFILILTMVQPNIDICDVAIAILSMINSVCLGLLALFRYKDSWHRYREYSELMKSHLSLYVSKMSPYDDTGTAEGLFAQFLEKVALDESNRWIHEQKHDPNKTSDVRS